MCFFHGNDKKDKYFILTVDINGLSSDNSLGSGGRTLTATLTFSLLIFALLQEEICDD